MPKLTEVDGLNSFLNIICENIRPLVEGLGYNEHKI